MGVPYTPPASRLRAFNCLHCGAYASQAWTSVFQGTQGGFMQPIDGLSHCRCTHCDGRSLWLSDTLVYPKSTIAPPRHEEMPGEVAAIYDEAASVATDSPRASAAMLRLAVDKLVRHLGGTGTLNAAIGQLVMDGLSPKIQQALDIVRVTGNGAVHPGVMDSADDPETVHVLFELINLICEVMIAQPKLIEEVYASLPTGVLDSITLRDGRSVGD